MKLTDEEKDVISKNAEEVLNPYFTKMQKVISDVLGEVQDAGFPPSHGLMLVLITKEWLEDKADRTVRLMDKWEVDPLGGFRAPASSES